MANFFYFLTRHAPSNEQIEGAQEIGFMPVIQPVSIRFHEQNPGEQIEEAIPYLRPGDGLMVVCPPSGPIPQRINEWAKTKKVRVFSSKKRQAPELRKEISIEEVLRGFGPDERGIARMAIEKIRQIAPLAFEGEMVVGTAPFVHEKYEEW